MTYMNPAPRIVNLTTVRRLANGHLSTAAEGATGDLAAAVKIAAATVDGVGVLATDVRTGERFFLPV